MNLFLGSLFWSTNLYVCFMPVLQCFDFCSFVTYFEIRYHYAPSFVLLVQIAWLLWTFCGYTWIFFPTSVRNDRNGIEFVDHYALGKYFNNINCFKPWIHNVFPFPSSLFCNFQCINLLPLWFRFLPKYSILFF